MLQCGQQIQTEHSLIKHAAHPANLQHRKRLRRRNAHPIYIAFFTENKNRVLNICSTIFKDHHHHCSWAVCWQITAENRGEWRRGILVFAGRRVRPSHIQTIQEFVRHRCFLSHTMKITTTLRGTGDRNYCNLVSLLKAGKHLSDLGPGSDRKPQEHCFIVDFNS